ncbi:hypothetical protein HDU98_006325 [Podochytrium sp. JEL0797]|nr:hypothetical protein HDU98_006325 [Podochytrium sp. JEL0797]
MESAWTLAGSIDNIASTTQRPKATDSDPNEALVSSITQGIDAFEHGLGRAKDAVDRSEPALFKRFSSGSLGSSNSLGASTDSLFQKRTAKLDLEPLLTFQEHRRLSKLNRQNKIAGSKSEALDASSSLYNFDNQSQDFVTDLDHVQPFRSHESAAHISILVPESTSKTNLTDSDSKSSHEFSSRLSLSPHRDFEELTNSNFQKLHIDSTAGDSGHLSSPVANPVTVSSENTREDLFYTTALNEHVPPLNHFSSVPEEVRPRHSINLTDGSSRMQIEIAPISLNNQADSCAIPVTNLEDLESQSLLPITNTTESATTQDPSAATDSARNATSSTESSWPLDNSFSISTDAEDSENKRDAVDEEASFELEEAAVILQGASSSLFLDSASTGTPKQDAKSVVQNTREGKLSPSPLLLKTSTSNPKPLSLSPSVPKSASIGERLRQLEQSASPTKKTSPSPTPLSNREKEHHQSLKPATSSVTKPKPSPSAEPVPKPVPATNTKSQPLASSPLPPKRSQSPQKRVFRTAPSLLLVKGKRKFHVTSIAVTPSSLSQNDVYVLEVPLLTPVTTLKLTGDTEEIRAVLYIWCGSLSGKVKRAKGKEVAYRMREKDWGTKAEIVEVVESQDDTKQQKQFWRALLGSESASIQRDVALNCSIADDLEYEKSMDAKLVLYGLNDAGVFAPVSTDGKTLSVKLINSGTCFVLECKGEFVYLWTGRGSNEDVREAGQAFANDLSLANGTTLIPERDLSESVLFLEKFHDWTDKVSIEVKQAKNIAPKDKSRAAFDRGAYKPAAAQVCIRDMFTPPPPPASWERQADGSFEVVDVGGPPPVELDRGKIGLKVWMAVGSEIVEVEKAEEGVLFSGECYLILYKHLMGREGNEKDMAIAYFWIGDNSKMTEQGTIAYAAIDLEKTHNARQVRVAQGHEPEHFLSIFRPARTEHAPSSTSFIPPLVIRRGSKSSASGSAKTLYCIAGSSDKEVRAVQVAWNIANFSSAAVFLVVMEDGGGMLWVGDGAHGYEREGGLNVANRLCGGESIQEIHEFCEPPGFWDQFGLENNQSPRGLYASVPYLLQKAKYTGNGTFKQKLWKVSHVVNGGATAELISPFTQRDLHETSVYILDAFFEIFVWVGRHAHASHKDIKLALSTALEYAEYAQQQQHLRLEYEKQRDQVRVWMIRDGHETLEFRSCFGAFDDETKDLGSVGSFRFFNALLESSNGRYAGPPKAEYAKTVLEKIEKGVYSVEELRNKDALPFGVDPSNVERHLSPDDFKKLFKTDLSTYQSYPAWKRLDLKKKAGIF